MLIHIEAHANDGPDQRYAADNILNQDSADLTARDYDIIWPLDGNIPAVAAGR
jgi:hypothetical protein